MGRHADHDARAHEAALISRYRYRYLVSASSHIENCFYEMMGEKEKPQAIYCGSSKQEVQEYEDLEKTESEYMKLLMSHHDREIGALTSTHSALFPHKNKSIVWKR